MSEEGKDTTVKKSGLAVVHEGDWISAGRGSSAVLSTTSTGGDIHLHFPIEVIVVGEIPDEARQEMEASIWTALHEALG